MKKFNTTGVCKKACHYMVDIQSRLEQIKMMVDNGDYFVINRARQYGKTTTLDALKQFIEDDYIVILMDFQFIGNANFDNEGSFVAAFSQLFIKCIRKNSYLTEELAEQLNDFKKSKEGTMLELFSCLSEWCDEVDKPVVLIIDEVDSASNNQVFLDFLAQLRGYYLGRETMATFHSVILAGLHDIKNLKGRLRTEDEHKTNSPWNIAADFDVDMSLSEAGICGMLREYEVDHHTGMDIEEISGLLYSYTEGYPFLVSKLCKLMDEKVAKQISREMAWTKLGFLEALKLLYNEKNTLFDSLTHRLEENKELKSLVWDVLFIGRSILYNPYNASIELAQMYGFVKNDNGRVAISNRIFETVLYNMFLSTADSRNTQMYVAGADNKNQYVKNGHLDMDMVIEKFVEHYTAVYGEVSEKFAEEEGRKLFLLYLRPIINGTGNYYVEAQTRDSRRTDVIVDYSGEQFIVEMKIWRGDAYNQDGEQQLSDYLDAYGLKKGYMLTFSFNRNKEPGVKPVNYGDKVLIEAVV